MCDRLAVLQTSRKDERLEGKSIAPLRTSPDTTLSDRGKGILGHKEVRKEVHCQMYIQTQFTMLRLK